VTQKILDLLASIQPRRNNGHQSLMMRNKSKCLPIHLKPLLLTVDRLEKKETKSDQHEEYLTAAHCITRCVNMFCNINKIINIGTLLKQRELTNSGDLSEDEDDAAH
jgi:hypothetical protein